jgi:hypothetical protein
MFVAPGDWICAPPQECAGCDLTHEDEWGAHPLLHGNRARERKLERYSAQRLDGLRQALADVGLDVHDRGAYCAEVIPGKVIGNAT